ncbi:MAG TPA: hypothetical protein VML75_24880 [Kofleriaceae bacterium]|nr:hypothetical protein [Kofleriaceae bacterium]
MIRLSMAVLLVCATTGALGCKSRSRSQEHQERPAVEPIQPAIKVMQRPNAGLQLRPVDPAVVGPLLPFAAPARVVKAPAPSANGAQLITTVCYDELEPAEAAAELERALTKLGWYGLSLRTHPTRPEAALSAERDALRLTARIEAGSAQLCGDTPAKGFAELTLHQVPTTTGPGPAADAAPAP